MHQCHTARDTEDPKEKNEQQSWTRPRSRDVGEGASLFMIMDETR